jgi:DNA polymerase III subunit gamma/tau
MAAQALYRKWRSQDFAEVVGQEHVTLTLRNALREGRMSHAYLFTGPRGTGKTSTARILAKAINCLDPDPAARPCNTCSICIAITEGRQLDLIEIDAASNRGIDEIRDLREKIGFRPNEARYKVYIIDEVHMLTKEAFNALLKTLEEPPPHAIFVLATTEPDRVPETVRSRCQRFDFRRIPTGEIVEHLAAILTDEGGKAEPEALVAIARRATGSMRDAVSLLDQLLSYGDDTLTLARVERVLGLVNAQTIGKLVDCIAANDTAGGLALLNSLVAEGVELGQLVDQIVAYLRAVLFSRMARTPELLDLPQDVIQIVIRQAQAFTPAALLAAVREFTEARAALRDQVPGVPQLPIELAFLRAAAATIAPVAAVAPAPAAPAATAPVVSTASAVHAAPAATAAAASASPSVPPSAPATRPAEARPAAALPNNELRQAVQANWEPFLGMAGKRCGIPVQAALRSVKEIETAGDAVVLRFSHRFSRDLVNRPEHRSQVEALWEELLKARVQVRCALVGEAVAAPSPAASSQAAPGQRSGLPQNDDDAFLDDARSLGAVVKKL